MTDIPAELPQLDNTPAEGPTFDPADLDVPVVCAGPGPHDPTDGIVGTAHGIIVPHGAGPYTLGMVCASPACQPAPTPDPVDPVTALVDAIRSASSLTDLQRRIVEENL